MEMLKRLQRGLGRVVGRPHVTDEDNSALEATDGDALAPTGPVLEGDE